MTERMNPEREADMAIDHERAETEARRVVAEYPHLIQPSETAHNLARAYRASRERERRLEEALRTIFERSDCAATAICDDADCRSYETEFLAIAQRARQALETP